MSVKYPNGVQNATEPPALLPLEDWMLEPGRTETFQDFVDALLGKAESVSAFQCKETGQS